MFGPLYYYELVRMARKGRSTVVRCGYALVVFATLFFVYRDHFPRYNPLVDPFAPETVRAGNLAGLAHAFVMAVLVLQTVAILVLTPAYLTGAIAGERERGTLDLLFMTHLRDREIVLGKLAAGVTHLGGVFLAGLPLLAATQLWGGVDFTALMAAFLAAGLNVVTVGSVSIFCSAGSRTTGEALGLTYGLVLTYLGVLGVAWHYIPYPFATTGFGVFFEMTRGPSRSVSAAAGSLFPLATCVAVNCVVTTVALLSAVAGLRSAGSPAGQRNAPHPAVVAPAKTRRNRGSVGSPVPRRYPPVGDWPLLWKEINPTTDAKVDRFLDRSWPVVVLLALLAGCFLATTTDMDSGAGIPWIVVGFIPLVFFGVPWCWVVGFCAAGSVCREREQRTLDCLLTLPASRSAVAGAKWLGAIVYSRIYYLAIIALAYLVGTGVSHPLRALLLLITFVAQIAFLSSLGLRVSVASPSVVRARVVMALLLIVFFAGGWVALLMDSAAMKAVAPFGAASDRWAGLPTAGWGQVRGLFYTVGLNPVGSLTFLSGLREPDDDLVFDRQFLRTQYAVAACGTLIYALAAGVLWLDAWRCFRAEPKG
jgi:ABC-type transport system involved in multi-copper enzyme maturation permease subunit